VLLANAVSNLGDGMLLAAAPLLATRLTDDARLVAAVAASATLPWLLVALVSGAVVDRLDRRLLRAVVDVLRAAALGVFALAVSLDVVELWMLAAVVFVIGIGETVADTAAQAMVPQIVPEARRRSANSQMEATTLVADRLLGPPLGGAVFVASATLPFALDALSFLLAAVLVASLRGSFRAVDAVAPVRLRSDVADGLRALFGRPLLASMTIVVGLWNLLDAMMLAVLVVYAQQRLGLGDAGYGVLLTATAIGGLVATATAARVVRAVGDGGALLLALGLSALAAAVLAVTTEPWVAGSALALFGWLGVTWNVSAVTLRQELVPGALLGRVTAAYRVFSLGALPVGMVLGGLLARASIRAPYAVAAVGSAVLTVAAVARLGNGAVATARAREAAG
jgi:Na+/melibiose symporter-like transporter